MPTAVKKERKRRLVWVDWLLILLMICGTALGVYHLKRRSQAALPTTEVLYTVCVSGVRREIAEDQTAAVRLIPPGTTVANENGTAMLGRVISVSWLPEQVAVVSNGEIGFVEHPDRVRLLITVQASATVSDANGVRINDIRICAGGTGAFRFGGFYSDQCKIVSVMEEEE